jgi:hypothetical protein
MQHALIFWPLHLLVLRAMAMSCPVRLCAIEDGRHRHPDLHREGVRWYSDRYPHRCRGIDVVVLEWPGSCWVRVRFSCSCWLCTVTSIPSLGAGATIGGPVAHCFARGLHVSLRRGSSKPRGSGAFDDVVGLGRGVEMSSEVLISPETSSQGSGGMEFVICTVSNWHVVRAFR